MGRVARIVVPGLAHHVTQRGNRRAVVFITNTETADADGQTMRVGQFSRDAREETQAIIETGKTGS